MHNVKNISYICGCAEQKYVQEMCESPYIYTHKPQLSTLYNFTNKLFTISSQLNHLIVHTLCVQFTAVNKCLFTLSTRPTITTIYIK